MKDTNPNVSPDNTKNLATTGSAKTDVVVFYSFLTNPESVLTSEECIKALIRIWDQEEGSNGSILKCKDDKVENVHTFALASFLAKTTGIVYVPNEKTFWVKDCIRGLWLRLDEDDLATRLLNVLITVVKEVCNKNLAFIAKQSLAKEVLCRLKHFAAQPGFFAPPRDAYILHCRNCFVVVDAKNGTINEHPLSDSNIHSRHQLNVDYVPDAECPRFKHELLSPIITEDETRVLFEYMGQVFLGYNISQKVLIFSGAAGGGKSTIVNIMEMILGRENVAELRTNALHGWYETSRYIGKSLLAGKDVPADFMRHKGASKLKALTGNDMISTEMKHSNDVSTFSGTFNVIITSNCNQPIQIQDDRDAWERRVLSIKCKKPKEGIKPIRDFDKELVETEGSGIFNEALKGLVRIIKAGGTIAASDEQRKEIADLLDESEGLTVFLKDMVYKGETKKDNLTSWELFEAYKQYCIGRGWKPKTITIVRKELVDAMAELFDAPRRTDVTRDGTNHRGYWGVRLKNAQENEAQDNRA